MGNVDPRVVVEQFNACINDRDLERLSSLITEDHVFIDASDEVHRGKRTMIRGWKDFFDQFPDYRNHFQVIESSGTDVLVIGRSSCSFKPLDGPALWTAKVVDGLVAEWRVYFDTTKNRKRLNLSTDIRSE